MTTRKFRHGDRLRVTGRVQLKPLEGEAPGDTLKGEDCVVDGRNTGYIDQATGEPCTVVTFRNGAIAGVPDRALSRARRFFSFGS